jgi:hypothetical protein
VRDEHAGESALRLQPLQELVMSSAETGSSATTNHRGRLAMPHGVHHVDVAR